MIDSQAVAPGRGAEPEKQRVTVILAAHGEAETNGFRENFMVGHRTLGHVAEVMALPAPLRLVICAIGATRKRLGAAGGSPHNALTRRQAEALGERLAADSASAFNVLPAFGSAMPLLEAVLDCREAGAMQIIVSMTPIDSRLACGRLCHHMAAAGPAQGDVRILARLWDDHEFISVNVEHVLTRLEQPGNPGQSVLVLVMHGTLVQDTKGRAPTFHTGLEESSAYAERLQAAFATDPRSPFARIEVAHLNHDVGGTWTRPTLDEVLQRLARDGVESVAAYPCEYLVDGSDTLGKVAVALAGSGIRWTQCLPCLNDAPELVEFLAGRVRELADSQTDGAARRCDACPLR